MKLKHIITISAAFFATYSLSAQPAMPQAASDDASPAAQKDGKLNPRAKERILRQFDKDGDGFLNEAELAEAKKFVAERRQKFLEMQRNAAEKIVKEYDKDGDGKLSAEELIPFLDKMNRMHTEELRKVRNANICGLCGMQPPSSSGQGMGQGQGQGMRPRDGRGDGQGMGMGQGMRPRDGSGPRGQALRSAADAENLPPVQTPFAPLTEADLDQLALPQQTK